MYCAGLSEGLARELAEYDINVVIIEPGAFRTNFLGAFKTNSKANLERYSTASTTMKIFETFQGKQRGDPKKAAQRIFELVGGEGPHADGPPETFDVNGSPVSEEVERAAVRPVC